MPKNVLQSNWYYGRDLSESHLRALDEKLGPTLSGPRVTIVVAPERLKGFMMAPWIVENKRENLEELLRSADNVADGMSTR